MISVTETGDFVINDGEIALESDFIVGEWVAVSGSRLNDGLYKIVDKNDIAYPRLYRLGNGTDDAALVDEPLFSGIVRGLSIDPALVALAGEIMEFNEKNKPTGNTSEKFGSYSYSRAVGANGAAVGWQETFAVRLRPYKQMLAKIRV